MSDYVVDLERQVIVLKTALVKERAAAAHWRLWMPMFRGRAILAMWWDEAKPPITRSEWRKMLEVLRLMEDTMAADEQPAVVIKEAP